MFCSVVIPTIGRRSLSHTVNSVLNQTFTADSFEVIVVNDSGKALIPGDWQQSDYVRIINTNQRERCIARNAGAAIAKGKYLCFLDDDDWLLPEALDHFWILFNQVGNVAWLYGGLRVVDGVGICIAEANSGLNGNCLAQIMGGAWAPIQASLVQAKMFFRVGGYNPSIISTEDLDLCRRVALHGEFANTPATVACLLRGETWDTSTNYLSAPENTLISRNDVLSHSLAFSRMLSSANSSYWYGRIFRVYLSTIRFNIKRKKVLSAIERAIMGAASLVLSGRHLFFRSFWEGVKTHHPPGTLHFVQENLERNVNIGEYNQNLLESENGLNDWPEDEG